jgi:hypothetical protein
MFINQPPLSLKTMNKVAAFQKPQTAHLVRHEFLFLLGRLMQR